jgi:hypothetical protein
MESRENDRIGSLEPELLDPVENINLGKNRVARLQASP